MKEVKAYKCEFCKKVVTTKYYMKKHEKKCFNNAESKSCATCEWLEYDEGGERYCRNGLNISKKLKTECEQHKTYDCSHG